MHESFVFGGNQTVEGGLSGSGEYRCGRGVNKKETDQLHNIYVAKIDDACLEKGWGGWS